MKKREFLKIFLIGSIAYSVIELLWRGRTHWTMFLTGGACFALIYKISQDFRDKNIIIRSFIDSIMITCVEFFVGCLANKLFDLHVWDYSTMKFNLGGQICLLYSVFWFLLCLPANMICDKLYFHIHKVKI